LNLRKISLGFKEYSKKISLGIKENYRKYEFVIAILYILALIAILVPLFWPDFVYSVVTFVSAPILTVALILRFVDFSLKRREKLNLETRTINWKKLRGELTNILSESKILLDAAVELKNGDVSSVIFSEEYVKDTFFEENMDFIETIREIGINGILCLLFLLQQQPAIVSVRAIHRSLQLPLATTYRCLQKMSDVKLITLHYLTEKPGKALYRITDEGSSTIIKLYELIGGSMLPPYEESKPVFETDKLKQ